MAGGLLSVEAARARLLAGVEPLGGETVALAAAAGRVLAAGLAATRTQPPFAASAMDGYALRAEDAVAGCRLAVIGTAPAGRAFEGRLGPGQCVRIFTGAPVPEGADTILIQENARVVAEREIEVVEPVATGRHIRAVGLDFRAGDVLIPAGTRLDWRTVSLAAAMNHPVLPVRRRPRVAVLATGDELVPPGAMPGPDQIVASNAFGVLAMVEAQGGLGIDLGIAADTEAAIAEKIGAALAAEADILVTLGGASVGDLDLVQKTLGGAGMDLGFWKIAMRPGKPLMFGTLGPMRVLGLPGNPVSGLVCALLFLKPLLKALLGLAPAIETEEPAVLAAPLPANDSRQDYLRATFEPGGTVPPHVRPVDLQDSSMLSRLTRADCLVVRAPGAEAAAAGDACRIIRF
ncbi:molybdopterin molybdotransferase MoeA [Prosthecodimorpha staleyi]|uniref:Molybdopterin molybdenumtransferase n=1 Tax=Prosthecodimorpha staleyi TaxID=2840188 RepID=A0A947D547_9HYPH|nr:gephyrin-like molybdotransferase Glp [Prosthecodimorpha staleyi]MBT9288322.1 molybdopterin molybdotransferase MoeA [Prosthecodimorpha staleyi]